MKVIDLAGRRFGALNVLSRSPREGRTYWLCRCDCGKETECEGYKLRAGCNRSCGCQRGENGRERWTKHGLKRRAALEYACWSHMRRRCFDSKSPDYKNYGGRGITVCERWNDFALFYADMGTRPSAAHTIERKNNDQSYSPENCVWATRETQNQNRRNVVRIVIEGRETKIRDLIASSGLSHSCIYKRIRRGVVGAALTGPSR